VRHTVQINIKAYIDEIKRGMFHSFKAVLPARIEMDEVLHTKFAITGRL
jgi:hypothetical protein